MSDGLLELIITLLLGGGLLKGIEAVYRAYVDNKEKKRLATIVGAKTPAEVESLSITTMAAALNSAEGRIKSLVLERVADQTHYEETFAMLRAHIKTLEEKIDRLQKQNVELIQIKFKEGWNANG